MTTFYKKMKLYKGRLKLLKLKNGYLFFFWKSCQDVVQWYLKINILTYKLSPLWSSLLTMMASKFNLRIQILYFVIEWVHLFV